MLRKRERSFFLLILPAVLIYMIFYLYPVISTFVHSFTDWSLLQKNIHFIGLDNYKALFHDDVVLTGIKNSILYAIIMTIVQNALAVPLAVALDRNLRTKNWLRMIFFAPAVLSPLVVGFLWSYIMSSLDYGPLNQILTHLGLGSVNWLGSAKLALYSVILTQVWQWTGWAMVIYLANLQGISKELFEAAHMDGANGWKTFWKITLPLLVPSITINTVLSMIGGLKVFDIIFSMTNGGPGHATESIVTVLLQRAFTDSQLGYASALGVLFSSFVMIVTVLQLRLMKRWEVS
ncbi:raffinose/stachyose/melibiose transport system permease protein [Paenibacillus shirakamiensis]|uniref:Raffinose/stachyose/melibiose transport system permease protein n=1 Tax=Paenibacillus shirakamiensis TaxID=1265935 RepID=A0ABS4JGD8_9BACL|nr:sugar ABC transporter permease [Paenibacillus shirakamiensis]MBP2000161.1 raffinose/stachyose/melibiose transport system permease protein [Paenibacillus shirakamiensis]